MTSRIKFTLPLFFSWSYQYKSGKIELTIKAEYRKKAKLRKYTQITIISRNSDCAHILDGW